MGRGNKYYNKDTERVRQLNQEFKIKYPSKTKKNLSNKIHGKDKVDSDFKSDMLNLYSNQLNTSVIMVNKDKHMKRFTEIILKGGHIKRDKKSKEELINHVFNNLDDYEQSEFECIKDASKFCDKFEENYKRLSNIGYRLPYPESYILKRKCDSKFVVLFNKQYLEEVNSIVCDLI